MDDKEHSKLATRLSHYDGQEGATVIHTKVDDQVQNCRRLTQPTRKQLKPKKIPYFGLLLAGNPLAHISPEILEGIKDLGFLWRHSGDDRPILSRLTAAEDIRRPTIEISNNRISLSLFAAPAVSQI